ncbi:MAG: TetR/AcrR family transcriptional regulator [Myxococcota bacterium]
MTTVAAGKSRHDGRRTPVQERARASCDAILEATARILSSAEGRELPSTNRIAKLAGVSVGTLYQYFDSREAILRALCRRHADEMMMLLLAHAGPLVDASPREAVPVFIDAMAAAHAVAPRLHLALVREMLADGGELLAEVQDPGRALVLAWLTRHRDVIRPRDLPAAAFLLTHTVEAAIHGQLLDDPSRLKDTAWRSELVDLMLRYLLP